ncbi:MAG: gamma-glutamylcyclotransferase family protein [Bryobacteraceae bacterium]
MNRLFVYGSLRSETGTEPARYLARRAKRIGPAKVQGRLYSLGSYPAMALSTKPHEWVQGELYRLPNPKEILCALDQYEGCGKGEPAGEFERVAVTAVVGETRFSCWAYVCRFRPPEDTRISSGDYVKSQ